MASLPLNTITTRSELWLLGRKADLFIGCGLLYLLSVPALVVLTVTTGTQSFPATVAMVVTLLLNAPHYGATILRVYDDREDRRKYSFFTVYVTFGLVVLLIASSWNVWLGSLLVTVYFTWSPWHFSGQNYGLMMMFLRRRGVDVDATTRKLLYTSFWLSALLAIMSVHGGNEAAIFGPATLPVANVPTLFKLGLPPELAFPLQSLTFLAYLGCLGAAASRLWPRTGIADLIPALLLVLSQALWFTVPAILSSWGSLTATSLIFASVWINAAHSAQYLWVTAYYAHRSGKRPTVHLFLFRSLVAGTAVTCLPALILAPHMIGNLPWDAGLAASLFAVVNLHHFFLDGAIWKLRDGRVARVLLRGSGHENGAASPAAPSPARWPRRLIWGVALCSLVVPVAILVQTELIRTAATAREADRAVQILKWIGRESTGLHIDLADRFTAVDNRAMAVQHYRRSIELFPTGRAWAALGYQHRAAGDFQAALAAFDAAIDLSPGLFDAGFRRAEMLLAIDDADSTSVLRAEAITTLEAVLDGEPDHADAAMLLARLQSEDGKFDRAILTLEASLRVAAYRDRSAIRERLDQLRRRPRDSQ